MDPEQSYQLRQALEAWRADSRRPGFPYRREAARMAMLDAARAQALANPHVPSVPLWRRLLVRRLIGAGGLSVAMAGLLVAGWSAPPGTPLHAVRLAHERIDLALAGVDRAPAALHFAEQRLAEWSHSPDPAASLQEASDLLSDARTHLPSGESGPLWTEWKGAETTLAADESTLPQPAGPTLVPAPGQPGSPPSGSNHAAPTHPADGHAPEATSEPSGTPDGSVAGNPSAAPVPSPAATAGASPTPGDDGHWSPLPSWTPHPSSSPSAPGWPHDS